MRVIDSEHPAPGCRNRRRQRRDHRCPNWPANYRAGRRRTEKPLGAMAFGTPWLRPGPLRPAERRTAVVEYGRDGMRLQIALRRPRVVGVRHIRPGRAGTGRDRIAVTASSQLRRLLVAFGRYPPSGAYRQQLGSTSRCEPRSGRMSGIGSSRVGGMSANGPLEHIRQYDGGDAPPELPVARRRRKPPATAWYALHDLARISDDKGADSLGDQWWAGGDRDRTGRRMQIFATAGEVPSGDNCCQDCRACLRPRSTEFAEQIRRHR